MAQYKRKSDKVIVTARPVTSTPLIDEEIENVGRVPSGHMVVTDPDGNVTCPSVAAFKDQYDLVAETAPSQPTAKDTTLKETN